MINPIEMTAIEWTDAMNLLLNGNPPTFKISTEDEWRNWGLNLFNSTRNSNLPNPLEFESWREWAQRLTDSIEL